MIYLDNAATTIPAPEVVEAMQPWLLNDFGNPGSIYSIGRQAHKAVEHAREQVAAFLNAEPDQIIFTSGGAEANNLAISGSLPFLRAFERPAILSTQTEHSSVLNAIRFNATWNQCFQSYFIKPGKDGSVKYEDVAQYIKDHPNTGLVSVMYVNNETGAVNDVKKIATFCREHDILFHTDCVQAAPELTLDVKEIGCDFLSVSSHKIHGPKGVGALYARKKQFLHPIIYGSNAQEFGLRGGTANVAGIVGFGAACDLTRLLGHEITRSHEIKLAFYEELKTLLNKIGQPFSVNGPSPYEYGRILNLCFTGIHAETLVLLLDKRGVCLSAGAACNGSSQQPSHVLTSMGVPLEQAMSSVRISFSNSNTLNQAVEAARIISDVISLLRD